MLSLSIEHEMIANNVTTPSRLLALPPEFRNAIYYFTLTSDSPLDITLGDFKTQTSLLRACKQTCGEALDLYFAENTFCATLPLGHYDKLASWLNAIGKEQIQKISKLEVVVITTNEFVRIHKTWHILASIWAHPGNYRKQTRTMLDKLDKIANRARALSAVDELGLPRERIEVVWQEMTEKVCGNIGKRCRLTIQKVFRFAFEDNGEGHGLQSLA